MQRSITLALEKTCLQGEEGMYQQGWFIHDEFDIDVKSTIG